ncbi:stage V sporulation protein K [Salinibacillus kushneri]|uniref:Stage V sporulation protein K n=1 Tax=Salinibacillus kushneri TaxID=237682 RepID=A0A1I0E2A3_9BACI|nr:AAA family ATPase [Salinibacillus kushneri]SET39034.1 stage V sporulation protein K [Salinibacillus kushneri]
MNLQAKRKGQINVVLHDQENPNTLKSYEITHNKDQRFRFIDQAFSSYIGMETLKHTLKEIYAKVLVNRKREEEGLKVEQQMLHMLFKGNPGTGKTSIAREIARLFHQMNLLSKGHLIEAERADLVGEYIGHTAQKTRDLIKKAMGGVLFIDEAYSLGRGGEKDFGKEAIDTLVKHMEDYHQDFVLILAGYPNEMDHFLFLNPGLKSRFPIIVDFKDYTVDELLEIAQIITERKQYELTQSAYFKFRNHLRELQDLQKDNFSNGRYVRNKVEEAIRRQALRLVATNRFGAKDLVSLKPEDFDFKNETYP